ncbi:hypothetical protein JZ751_007190 [Albula glossodonta]|uniref:Uncharacterized protein n=1 Tax=Albula glossodonta TaxID=121402 RepID=A0A8T2P0D4_9TELE|nr:hypothetical protein JZ751_007190 [Albula glossodonta]
MKNTPWTGRYRAAIPTLYLHHHNSASTPTPRSLTNTRPDKVQASPELRGNPFSSVCHFQPNPLAFAPHFTAVCPPQGHLLVTVYLRLACTAPSPSSHKLQSVLQGALSCLLFTPVCASQHPLLAIKCPVFTTAVSCSGAVSCRQYKYHSVMDFSNTQARLSGVWSCAQRGALLPLSSLIEMTQNQKIMIHKTFPWPHLF